MRFGRLCMVEMTGFEPATPCPPDMYATKLRHISMQQWYYNNFTPSLQVGLSIFLFFRQRASIMHACDVQYESHLEEGI